MELRDAIRFFSAVIGAGLLNAFAHHGVTDETMRDATQFAMFITIVWAIRDKKEPTP